MADAHLVTLTGTFSGTESGTSYCWLGSYNAHTWNYERTECLWCGPNKLAWKPGHWVDTGDGFSAWSATPSPEQTKEHGSQVDCRALGDAEGTTG